MCDEIRIYVADLAAYNNGKLHGVWINACDDLDEIHAQVQAMLKDSPEPDAEEWAIHDYEGFGACSISEYEGFESVREKALFISDYPSIGSELLIHFNGDVDEARRVEDECYGGCYKSAADLAQDLTEQSTKIPENLAYYIDYEAMARDMELNGDIYAIETAHDEVHVFWNG